MTFEQRLREIIPDTSIEPSMDEAFEQSDFLRNAAPAILALVKAARGIRDGRPDVIADWLLRVIKLENALAALDKLEKP